MEAGWSRGGTVPPCWIKINIQPLPSFGRVHREREAQ
jgi:hypothetical protein